MVFFRLCGSAGVAGVASLSLLTSASSFFQKFPVSDHHHDIDCNSLLQQTKQTVVLKNKDEFERKKAKFIQDGITLSI